MDVYHLQGKPQRKDEELLILAAHHGFVEDVSSAFVGCLLYETLRFIACTIIWARLGKELVGEEGLVLGGKM